MTACFHPAHRHPSSSQTKPIFQPDQAHLRARPRAGSNPSAVLPDRPLQDGSLPATLQKQQICKQSFRTQGQGPARMKKETRLPETTLPHARQGPARMKKETPSTRNDPSARKAGSSSHEDKNTEYQKRPFRTRNRPIWHEGETPCMRMDWYRNASPALPPQRSMR